MFCRILAGAVCVLLAAACQDSSPDPRALASPTMPSPATVQSLEPERPWKAQLNWAVTELLWAGAPGTKSDFGGRCSVPSDYICRAEFEGEATHAGHVTGQTEHCTQITWSEQGPTAVTYDDGTASFIAADGSELSMTFRNETFVLDVPESTFTDTYSIVGGKGRFAGATGRGLQGGHFTDLNAVLSGAPVPMWMEGTITYRAGRQKRRSGSPRRPVAALCARHLAAVDRVPIAPHGRRRRTYVHIVELQECPFRPPQTTGVYNAVLTTG